MSGAFGLGGHRKEVTRGSLVCLALLAVTACSKSPTNHDGGGTTKIVAPVAHPNIYGRWEMTKDDNDYPKLRKALSITEKHFTGWPVIETDENGSIIFHFTQMSKTVEPGSPDIVQACYIQRIIWNPNTTGDTREFYIDCDEKPDYSGFGGSEFIYGPRKVKYNLRIFGQHFERLRFQDHDGLVYYFKRVREDPPPTSSAEIGYYAVRLKENNGSQMPGKVLCLYPGGMAGLDCNPVKPGDTLLVTNRFGTNSVLPVASVSSAGELTEGWLKGAVLDRLPAKPDDMTEWIGTWKRGIREITISPPQADGYLVAEGAVTVEEQGKPDRTGAFAAKFQPKDGYAAFADSPEPYSKLGQFLVDKKGREHETIAYDIAGDFLCKVTLHRIANFLVVEDNGRCGDGATLGGIYGKVRG